MFEGEEHENINRSLLTEECNRYVQNRDRLCGLVVRDLGYRSGGPGSILGTTGFSGGGGGGKRKKSRESRTGSSQPREYN
jgi:hypothetical protein